MTTPDTCCTLAPYFKVHAGQLAAFKQEVHGPESQLALLREPLAALNPQFFSLEFGFRR